MVIYYSRLNEENYNKIVCKAKQNKCLIIFFQMLIAKKKKLFLLISTAAE